jgi:hypothetical protein
LGMGLKGTLVLCVRMISHTRHLDGSHGLGVLHGGHLACGGSPWCYVLWGQQRCWREGELGLAVPTGPVTRWSLAI